MRDAENIRLVGLEQPRYMGFIFYERSPRYVGPDFSIDKNFPREIKRVGVFVNASTTDIILQAQQHKLDLIQLHGHEPVKQLHELKQHNIQIIKAFGVDDNFDFEQTLPYEDVADFFLFDTKGKYFGGNATTFNWTILTRYHQRVPFFLSGGLNADNVQAIRGLMSMNLHAIDVNSGIELQPGLKDVNKLRTLKHTLDEL